MSAKPSYPTFDDVPIGTEFSFCLPSGSLDNDTYRKTGDDDFRNLTQRTLRKITDRLRSYPVIYGTNLANSRKVNSMLQSA